MRQFRRRFLVQTPHRDLTAPKLGDDQYPGFKGLITDGRAPLCKMLPSSLPGIT
jgi:hypothetical protein